MGREMGRAPLFHWLGMLKELPDLLVSLVTVEETQEDSEDWRFSLRLSSQPASPFSEGLRAANAAC